MKTVLNTSLTSLGLALLMVPRPAVAQHESHGNHSHHVQPQSSSSNQQHHHATHQNHSQTSHTPVPTLSQADLAAAFPATDPHAMQHAPRWNHFVLIDQLEGWDNAHGSGQNWQGKAWLGGDINRLWLRSEGQRVDKHLATWSVDALYGRALSPWWDVVAGVRHDSNKQAADLTRAVIGVQGVAPYHFELSATAYLGGTRKAELIIEAEYNLLLSNRLIFQPLLETHWVSTDDRPRGVGNGLNKIQTGVRLRYEITRRFSPYIGFVHERHYGTTADWQRESGQSSKESRWVAGLRVWF